MHLTITKNIRGARSYWRFSIPHHIASVANIRKGSRVDVVMPRDGVFAAGAEFRLVRVSGPYSRGWSVQQDEERGVCYIRTPLRDDLEWFLASNIRTPIECEIVAASRDVVTVRLGQLRKEGV